MPTANERHRNNVKAGIFVTLTTFLVLGVVAVLKNAWSEWLTPRDGYAVRFSVADGVQSLGRGSIVRVGGIEMGSVTDVELEGLGSAESPPDSIIVHFEIDSRVPLYSNAFAYVKGSLIGSDAWIEITSVGYPTQDDLDADGHSDGRQLAANDLSTPDNILSGADAGNLLSTLVGPDGAANADRILADIAEFTPFLARIDGEYEKRVVPILDDAGQATADVRKLVATLKDEDWPRWVLTVNQALDNALAASEKLDLAMADGRELIANAEGTVNRANEAIDHNRPAIDEFIANLNNAGQDVQELADRLANQTADKLEALLDRGQEGVDSFATLADRVELEFDVLVPQLRDSMASVQIASNELSLAITEVRSSPWRLLYRPSTDELEHENLYFAASKFALAASELKMASQSVERAISFHREFLDDNPDKLEELQRNLTSSYQRYESAQRDLLDILSQGDP